MRGLLLIFLCIKLGANAQPAVRLASPNGQLVVTLKLTKQAPTYAVTLRGKPLVDPSPLTLDFAETGLFGPNLKLAKPQLRRIDETYTLTVGKASRVVNRAQEGRFPLVERDGARRRVELVVRIFDDGVAFRYEFPEQPGWATYTLTDEHSTFRLAGNPMALTLFRPNFLTSHEGVYDRLPLDAIRNDTLMDMPTLFVWPNQTCLAITEAALLDYAGMYLVKKNGILTSQLSPLPGQAGVKVRASVKATLPHRSPWRVLLIGEGPGTLLESNILTSLNEPSRLGDTPWLQPGKTTFPWWNGTIVPDTTFAPGNNFETNQYYIDFCAANGIEYHSVVEYGGHEWYVSDGVNYQPGPNANCKQPVPGLDMQQVCHYARQKGVRVRVWVHWDALRRDVEGTFAQYEAWGISGMMVDFMDRDDQEMVRWQEMVVQAAARHKLHVQFHGAYKPTGLHRTYPNEFTREGVLNHEYMKWSDLVTPDHDLNIAFTRLLAGPTDYHMGGFRARSPFLIHHIRPFMQGTRCHQLAQYVVYESYLNMVADYPDAYRNQPGFAFIRHVPTTWDQTRVPLADVSQYVSIARRAGTDWWVGTLNNNTARTVQLPLAFLPDDGPYEATLYADAPDVAQQPNHLTEQTRTLRRTDTLTIQLAAGGGHAIRLRKSGK
jgi:alpha-glucosidase